jgi:hypothetical protein
MGTLCLAGRGEGRGIDGTSTAAQLLGHEHRLDPADVLVSTELHHLGDGPGSVDLVPVRPPDVSTLQLGDELAALFLWSLVAAKHFAALEAMSHCSLTASSALRKS